MKKNFGRVAGSLLVLCAVAFLSGGGWTLLLSRDRSDSVYKNLEKFARVYDIVKKNYVKEPGDTELIDGSIRGMLEELDPHSVYLTKEDFGEMQADTRGEFGGLGIEIAKRDGVLTVVSPIEDTPAARAGLQSGDIIAKIEEKLTTKMSVIDAVRLMRGKPGTKINITVKRPNVEKLIPFTITRAVIQVQSVTHKVIENYGVIRVRQFLERSADELRAAIQKMKSEDNIRGLVIDLRNNPGGLLQQAIEISDLFLDEGLIVYTQGRERGRVSKSYASEKGTEPDYPVAVLVNGGSASASEIVAGALQDQKRGYVIGTRTFGKGSVQNVIPLEDGSGIKLTVALYYTPGGRQIQGAGIIPDEFVRAPNDPEELTRESDLPGHIVGAEEEDFKKRVEAARRRQKQRNIKNLDTEIEDIQLAAAIAYLKEATKTAQKQSK